MKKAPWLLVLILFLGCYEEKKEELVSKDSSTEFFEIRCDRDTTLNSEEGVTINIKANTFDCKRSTGSIQVEFNCILTKSDMILNEIYTVEERGRFLESGGMVRIKDVTNGLSVFRKPITIEIPTSIVNDQMSVFQPRNVKGQAVWSIAEGTVGLKNADKLLQGKNLYKENCASCHDTDLRKNLTGPALGNIHLYRSEEWLIEFTKSSQLMITNGDSIARCVWQQWKPVLMVSFENLSTDEIQHIYEFLRNESQLQAIGLKEVDHVLACEREIFDTIFNLEAAEFLNIEPPYRYLLELADRQWVNIDYLAVFGTEIDPIIVEVEEKYDDLHLALAFEKRNIVIPFVRSTEGDNKYSLWHPLKREKIGFPIGERVNIVAYTNVPDFRYRIVNFVPKETDNNIKMNLKQGAKEEFLKEIESL